MSGELTQAQRDFLELLVVRKALQFGDFTLKSGRHSPYFINTGCFFQGDDLTRLGSAYAATVLARCGSDIQVVFGPAYKGIPLALATAQAYQGLVGRAVGWSFDRKQAKDHGDGGQFVGAPLTPRLPVVIVDDVLTAGTALRESLAKLAPTGVEARAAIVAVDRQEKGRGQRTAIEEITHEVGLPVHAIITISQAIAYLSNRDVGGRRYLSAEQERSVLAHMSAAHG